MPKFTAALFGAVALGSVTIGSASAGVAPYDDPVSTPQVQASGDHGLIQKVWWRRGYGYGYRPFAYRRWGYGWGYGRGWCYWHPYACYR
jgi:hypothetical protein